MSKGESACKRIPKFLKRWTRQAIDLICLEKELKLIDGSLKADLLPGLKKINPTIECFDRFMTSVVKVNVL